jgi:hypothetical protein
VLPIFAFFSLLSVTTTLLAASLPASTARGLRIATDMDKAKTHDKMPLALSDAGTHATPLDLLSPRTPGVNSHQHTTFATMHFTLIVVRCLVHEVAAGCFGMRIVNMTKCDGASLNG